MRFPCVHAAATTPVQRLGVVFARVTQPCQPSPVPRPDRPAHRPFRGLLSVHSRCGLHTRTVTVCRNRYPKASDTSSPPCLLRSLPAGAVAGWGLHPLEKRRLVTAHVVSGPSAPSRLDRRPGHQLPLPLRDQLEWRLDRRPRAQQAGPRCRLPALYEMARRWAARPNMSRSPTASARPCSALSLTGRTRPEVGDPRRMRRPDRWG